MYSITGAVGFIGSHLKAEIPARGIRVVGVDKLESSYGTILSIRRLDRLRSTIPSAQIIEGDLCDPATMDQLVHAGPYSVIFHLAAWPGVKRVRSSPLSM